MAACAITGLGVGLVGFHFTGNQQWFLAFPAVIACGWLFFAEAQCLLPPERGEGEQRNRR